VLAQARRQRDEETWRRSAWVVSWLLIPYQRKGDPPFTTDFLLGKGPPPIVEDFLDPGAALDAALRKQAERRIG